MFNKVLESKCFFWAIVASYTNSYDKYFSKVSQGGKKKQKWIWYVFMYKLIVKTGEKVT